jgi:hypothetical protein
VAAPRPCGAPLLAGVLAMPSQVLQVAPRVRFSFQRASCTWGDLRFILEREEEVDEARPAHVIALNRVLMAAATSFVGGAGQFDDVTRLVLKCADEALWADQCAVDAGQGQMPPPSLGQQRL